jgi:alkaline phosphatase D
VNALQAGGAAATASLLGPRPGFPAIVTSDASRPGVPCGAQVGDLDLDSALVWSRTDRPARMLVEWDTTDAFRDVRRILGPAALEDSDHTARTVLTGLPRGQRIFYRVRFQDLTDLRTWSETAAGSFVTPPADSGDVTLAWSADTVGQGWGIDRDRGGIRMYDTMRRAAPDLFVHVGDTIYADNALKPEVTLEDGSLWRNLVTPAKSKVAETLDEFRGNFQYNFLDDNRRRFDASLSQIVLWDDHEVLNNWYPGGRLDEDDRYRVKSVDLLAARAKRAFFEYSPIRAAMDDGERVYRSRRWGRSLEIFALDMRTARGANGPDRQTELGPDAAMLGAEQLEWLKTSLRASTATWKVIAADQPLALVVGDGPGHFEAMAQGDDGPPMGRELELASLLSFLKRERVRNVVWITGDVHYAAAHHYDPARARFKDFDPFWELVAGPLHAGTFGPAVLDATFGPEVRFLGIPAGMKPNRPPSEGLQFFGTVRVSGREGVLTARLHDVAGQVLFSVDLEPHRG